MEQYILLIIGSLLSILGTLLVLQFKGMRTDLHDLSKSVARLNEQIATVLADQAWQKERISILEKQLNEIRGQ